MCLRPAAVDLLQTKEFICRAWDSSMNTQPMNFTWNLMGMMNNYAYKVKVGIMITPDVYPDPTPKFLPDDLHKSSIVRSAQRMLCGVTLSSSTTARRSSERLTCL